MHTSWRVCCQTGSMHVTVRNMLQDASKADDDPAQSAAESTHAASTIVRVGHSYPAYTASGSLLPCCAHNNVSLTCIFMPPIDFPAPISLHMMPCLLRILQMLRQCHVARVLHCRRALELQMVLMRRLTTSQKALQQVPRPPRQSRQMVALIRRSKASFRYEAA